MSGNSSRTDAVRHRHAARRFAYRLQRKPHWRSTAPDVGAFVRALFPRAQFFPNGWAPARCPLPTHLDPELPLFFRETGNWWCSGGCGRGDELALVMQLHGVTFPEAVKILSGCNR